MRLYIHSPCMYIMIQPPKHINLLYKSDGIVSNIKPTYNKNGCGATKNLLSIVKGESSILASIRNNIYVNGMKQFMCISRMSKGVLFCVIFGFIFNFLSYQKKKDKDMCMNRIAFTI